MNAYQQAQILRQRENSRKRQDRLRAAREKGTHSSRGWFDMVDFFEGTCVRCKDGSFAMVKDHIKPIYQGGSDGLDNIQPLCRSCNSSKGPESVDYRPSLALSLGKILPEKYKLK